MANNIHKKQLFLVPLFMLTNNFSMSHMLSNQKLYDTNLKNKAHKAILSLHRQALDPFEPEPGLCISHITDLFSPIPSFKVPPWSLLGKEKKQNPWMRMHPTSDFCSSQHYWEKEKNRNPWESLSVTPSSALLA